MTQATTTSRQTAIRATNLVKRYGSVTAVDGLSLEVPAGTVLGLLGPNGAGKTTTVRMLTTLLRPDAGTAAVWGLDVVRQADDVRRMIGLSGQYAAVDDNLTARENLQMIGRLYHLSRRVAKARAQELIERFDLVDAADRTAKTYSGGMRRRLDLACALVIRPPVIVLDEPTTGLDPRSRIGMWDMITELVAGGATVLLTTQYLEEADRLAHDIVVVDRGRVVARGTPDQLKSQAGSEHVDVVVRQADELDAAAWALYRSSLAVPGIDRQLRRLTVPTPVGFDIGDLITEVVRILYNQGIRIDDIGVRRSTLDDVFLAITGHATQELGGSLR